MKHIGCLVLPTLQHKTYPFQLQYKFPFHIAHGRRTHTAVVFVKLTYEGAEVWGEAALPPYLPETQESVVAFIEQFAKRMHGALPEEWHDALQKEEENMPARAALDMALWQLKTKRKNTGLAQLSDMPQVKSTAVNCFYTIGLCSPEEMSNKLSDGWDNGFRLFKLKLDGSANDYAVVENFTRLQPETRFAVDMNSAYTDTLPAARFIEFLLEKNCSIIEQPMHKSKHREMTELNHLFPGVLYADESCQRLGDLEKLKEAFSGINIKLMKCGGITEALQMMYKARELQLHTLIGCMSESAVGCTAAAAISSLADWVDLDGLYLITNDPFTGMRVEQGRLCLYPLQQVQPVQ